MVTYKFQYLSDIHLEFYNENVNKIQRIFGIDNKHRTGLLLAGDVAYQYKPSYSFF